jgi:ribosomal protein L19E
LKKQLNAEVLKIGDIILTTGINPVSKVIRAATRSDVSHAMVYVESHS